MTANDEECLAEIGLRKISSVPMMFVFDRQGKTAMAFYGAPEDLRQNAERLLNSLVK